MQVAIQRLAEGWEVTALEGRFEGQLIARVDGIVLHDALFAKEGVIVGSPSAVWGATLEDHTSTDRMTVFGLGINRPFDMRPNRKVVFNGEFFTVEHGNARLVGAEILVVLNESIYFWKGR